MLLPTRLRRLRSDWPFEAMHDDLDRIIQRWWGGEEAGDTVGAYPVDIHEDQDHVYVDAELPGFTKDHIDVTLENGVLTIAAEREDQPTKGQTHLNERRYRRVARRFTLPSTLDETKVDAKMQDGVLHLTMDKREEVKPRRIEVK